MSSFTLAVVVSAIAILCRGNYDVVTRSSVVPGKSDFLRVNHKNTNHRNQHITATAKEERPDYKRSLPAESRYKKTIKVWLTAYSSTPDQTDGMPWETSLGTRPRHGIVATNLLPLGTRLKIPEIFGERVFVVEDRMHPRKRRCVDIWMRTRREAKIFGKRRTVIVLVGNAHAIGKEKS